MIKGVYIIGFTASDMLRQFAIRSIMLDQVISGCRVGFLFLGVSSRLAEASSHNVTGRADMDRYQKLGTSRVPNNLKPSPIIGIPW